MMKQIYRTRIYLIAVVLALVLAGCRQEPEQAAPTTSPTEPAPATPTVDAGILSPTAATPPSFVTIAIDAPFPPFENIDEFGSIVGFDADVMANIAPQADFDYEFVITSYDQGFLRSVANGEFDAAMSALVIPDTPPEGITFTTPYLELGQVLVVRANETTLQSAADIQPGTPIGVEENSSGAETAQALGITAADLHVYDTIPAALQALIDGDVDGAIIDSDDADHFTTTYYQQLKIAGGSGRDAWISSKAYGIAVADGNEALRESLNEAITQVRDDGTIDRLARAWLIEDDTIRAGESLIGTPANELVIGISGALNSLDPGDLQPDLISWEIKSNTMGGLFWNTGENELVPLLFDNLTLSEDKKEYTFRLRDGLIFPDGSNLTADDVRWSVLRSARLGNWLVNAFLKDENGDGFADEDAVTVVDPLTVKFVLAAPISYFPSLLATPPYFVISDECFSPNTDPASTCGGIGPYTIQEWISEEKLQLKANPQWPGPAPAFENIQVRFYPSAQRMRESLAIGAIDVAWTGLSDTDLLDLRPVADYRFWSGPSDFKSYLIFVQDKAPWNVPQVRQAVAYAVDRQTLATEVFQETRTPLYSPIPDGVPGHAPTQPARNLDEARRLLAFAGYTPDRPLPITIWYISDGRYTDREEAYANAIKSQLEETGVFQVTLQGAPWDVFRNEKAACNYPAYLMGWPSPNQPVAYSDAMSWLYYFLRNTDTVCSNYQNPEMDRLLGELEGLDPLQVDLRLAKYGEIQALWATDLPALDLTQAPRTAVALPAVKNVVIDDLGLMHYEVLTKGGG
ncbi:MAG: transporter substrate-binding domain-containing protein [Anaerolineales bacterium]|nr:transporter substrate-binding domain-containing protein [Anaerolineales bacterium]MCB8954346.1 transporter substrate-binding domain-containing protein [Ardenticatenales bacterium]